MKEIKVFLFPHQDDEFAVYPEIIRCLKKRDKVIIIYLTTGTLDGQHSEERCNESIKVLNSLGLDKNDIIFIGDKCVIPDGQLSENLFKAYDFVCEFVSSFKNNIICVYFPAWEGGHPDHDSSHILGVALGQYLKIIPACLQFPLYNNASGRYRIRYANQENGSVKRYRVGLYDRLKFFYLTFCYKSQTKKLNRMMWEIRFNILFDQYMKLQNVSVNRLFESPHNGQLRYEQFGKFSQKKFISDTMLFLNTMFKP